MFISQVDTVLQKVLKGKLNMAALMNLTMGEHRGSPRIYLQSSLLDEFGTAANQSHYYDRDWLGDKLILKLSDTGKFKVSSKKAGDRRVNVIDINTKRLSSLFDDKQKLRVAIKKGMIVIQPHIQEQKIVDRERRFRSKLALGQALDIGSVFHGG